MVSLLPNGGNNENKHEAKIHQGENQNDKTKGNSDSVLVREMQINTSLLYNHQPGTNF